MTVHKIIGMTTEAKPILTPEECAGLLSVSTSTLSSWRFKGGVGPAYLKLTSGLVRYDRQTVLNWARSTEQAA
jgi:predicted DNA-binding transcriptional regulator AlpA